MEVTMKHIRILEGLRKLYPNKIVFGVINKDTEIFKGFALNSKYAAIAIASIEQI
jgi:hypothetical protein